MSPRRVKMPGRVSREQGEQAQFEHLLQRLGATIDRHGWAVVYVMERPTSLAYTVGLAAMGHPELAVSGLPQEVAHGILNQVAEELVQGRRRCEPGSVDRDVVNVPVMYVEVGAAERRDVLKVAWWMARDLPSWRALCLVWTDREGRFPWDPGFDPTMRGFQPLAGTGPGVSGRA